MSFGSRLKRRWASPHFRQSVWIGTVAILGGAVLAAIIQERFDLYSSSFTMTLFSGAAVIVGVLILWMLDQKRYGWAWGVTLVAPVAVYFAFTAVLEANPPIPPMG